MSDLRAMHAIADLAKPQRLGHQDGPAGITVSERTGIAIATVIARSGQKDALAKLLKKSYSVALPAAGQRTEGKGLVLVWAGVDQFLAIVESPTSDLEAELRGVLGATASVSDQSDGRVVLRLSGPHVRDVLAKGGYLDFHPLSFKPGDAALTVIAHIGVHLWQLGDGTVEIAMFRSFALSFWSWLTASAAEYGLTVEA